MGPSLIPVRVAAVCQHHLRGYNSLYFSWAVRTLSQGVLPNRVDISDRIGVADTVMSLIAEVIELVDLVSELAVGVVDGVLDMAVQDLALVRVLVVDEYIKVHVTWYQELASGVGSLDILLELVLIMVSNHPMPKDFHPQ